MDGRRHKGGRDGGRGWQGRHASVVRRSVERGDDGLVGAGRRDGVVRVLKDVVLGAIAEIVEVGVDGWGERALVHLVQSSQHRVGVIIEGRTLFRSFWNQ